MVKQIKEFRSELQSIVLFQFEILNGRKVGGGQAGSRNDVSPTVSVRPGCDLGRLHEGACIEILRNHVGLTRVTARHGRSGHEHSMLATAGAIESYIDALAYRKWRAALKRVETRKRPSVDQGI